jgi:anti-anti-sigma factor
MTVLSRRQENRQSRRTLLCMSPLTITTPAAAQGETTFRARASRTDATALIAFRGELDLAAAPRAAAALRRQLDAGVTDLLVDLADVDHLDCAGLAALIEVAREAHAIGARVYLFRAHGRPAELIGWARERCAIAGF